MGLVHWWVLIAPDYSLFMSVQFIEGRSSCFKLELEVAMEGGAEEKVQLAAQLMDVIAFKSYWWWEKQKINKNQIRLFITL